MRRLTFYSFFFLLFIAILPQQGQAYNITESVSFTPDINCNQVVSPADNPAYVGPTISFTYAHNFGSGQPFNTARSKGWRYVRLKIYDVDQNTGGETLEKTIEEYMNWMTNWSYTLGESDFADLDAGTKVVRLEVEYYFSPPYAHSINLQVNQNGVQNLYVSDFQFTANHPAKADMGEVACLDWKPCDAELNVTGYVTSVPLYDMQGNIVGFVPEVRYCTNITGGSGNFTHFWHLRNNSNINSSGTCWRVQYSQKQGEPAIELDVYDNVTGCTYHWNNWRGKTLERTDDFANLGLTLAPNPQQAGTSLRVQIDLPEADQIQLEVYSLDGKLVKSFPGVELKSSGPQMLEFDANLKRGLYLVKLNSNEQGSVTQRLQILD